MPLKEINGFVWLGGCSFDMIYHAIVLGPGRARKATGEVLRLKGLEAIPFLIVEASVHALYFNSAAR